MMRYGYARTTAVATLALAIGLAGCSSDDDGDEATAAVSFAAPEDGATVASPVQVDMTATGLEVAPAADAVEDAGHLHVMVDTDCITVGEPIPNDDTHLHFGDGSTTTELELEPGEHTLCLQFASNEHIASEYTDTVTITVE